MNDGQNVNQIVSDRVENAVWESRQQRAAYPRNDFCIQEWDLFKAFELEFKGQLEFRAKAFALFLIPIKRFANFAKSPP